MIHTATDTATIQNNNLAVQPFPEIIVTFANHNSKEMVGNFLLVGLGGAIGSMARYGITILFNHLSYASQWGTLTANIIGSFLIGLLIATTRDSAYLFGAVGVCGGFTTFSTFSSQALELLQSGQRLQAALYIIVSIISGLLATLFGIYLGNRLT